MTTQAAYTNVINHTNNKLASWYSNAKKEYGVIGSGSTTIENDTVTVSYNENGEQKTWSMPFYPEYTKTQNISWVFNCWAESIN